MDIRGLGYVGFESPDPKQWLEFATGVIGMMPARSIPGESAIAPGQEPPSGGSGLAPDGTAFLKMDERRWRVAVHPGETAGLRYVGFEVTGIVAFERAIAELEERGTAVTHCSEEEAQQRSVQGLAAFADPSGNRIELFHGPVSDFKFVSPVGVKRFVTGELGLGHLALFVSDMEATLDFLIRTLGFDLSDFVRFGPGLSIQFLRCSPRHHTIAVARIGDICGLHHLMLEVEDVDEVGQALERAEAAGIPITATLGRHRNDNMLSFYMRSPAGFDVEIGCDGMHVGDGWIAREMCEADVWGHKGLTPDAMQAAGDEIDPEPEGR
ncbi:MAG: VOC family protein [Deltaproteobacteria bacterium]|nr:VOC family protein [Deltaproteobacteria bacterium]MBW2360798.1 VOC family protein [Deltaproteobacteria bacterium]